MERCIRCDGPLEQGFLLDRGHYDVSDQARWASGAPNTSFWRAGAVQDEARTLPVVTFRCTSCGRLESFARSTA